VNSTTAPSNANSCTADKKTKKQWHTQKFFMGSFHSVAYGGHLYLVWAICDVTIRRHVRVSKSTFWRSLLTQYAYSFTRTLHISCVIALNLNYQRYRLGYRRKIHTQRYDTAVHNCKNIRLSVKIGEKTHSSLRQSYLQLQFLQ